MPASFTSTQFESDSRPLGNPQPFIQLEKCSREVAGGGLNKRAFLAALPLFPKTQLRNYWGFG